MLLVVRVSPTPGYVQQVRRVPWLRQALGQRGAALANAAIATQPPPGARCGPRRLPSSGVGACRRRPGCGRGCRASWSPRCSPPCPGEAPAARAAGRVRQQGRAGKQTLCRRAGRNRRLGAAENALLFFSHAPNANRCFLSLKSLHTLQLLSLSRARAGPCCSPPWGCPRLEVLPRRWQPAAWGPCRAPAW